MRLKPLSDHIIIEPMAREEMTKSGIVLPGIADKEKPQEGTVIAAGPGKYNDKGDRIPMSVKKGDRILFSKYSPQEIKIKDKEYLIVREEDVIAIIE